MGEQTSESLHSIHETGLRSDVNIRFFDSRSEKDISDLKEIMENPGYKDWMDDSGEQSKTQIRDWMNE